MGFQEYWNRLPFPSPGDLLNLGIEPASPVSPALQADSFPAEPLGKPNAKKNRNKIYFTLMAQLVKCLPAIQETRVRSLGREDPLEKEMATHSRILA